MAVLSTICRFLILAKHNGYLLSSILSNVANFIEPKRSADRRERRDVFFLGIPEPTDKKYSLPGRIRKKAAVVY